MIEGDERGVRSPLAVEIASEENFWRRVSKMPGGCWVWIGPTSKGGYGIWSIGRGRGNQRHVPAHRVAWMLLRGPIPDGHDLDHLVDGRCIGAACVNPDHLEPVTPEENRRRQSERRRAERSS